MGSATAEMKSIPSAIIDRYPGKMVGHLAKKIVTCYGSGAKTLLDPYCGSSALLSAAKELGISVTGVDINPFAALLSAIKLNGFKKHLTYNKLNRFLGIARSNRYVLPMDWEMKNYWFTLATLAKYESLRGAAKHMELHKTQSGKAILLALALSARPCSRADQRSPKPFISKTAIATRKGKRFDPIKKTEQIFYLLGQFYGKDQKQKSLVLCDDITNPNVVQTLGQSYTHIMTSPPYVNAQDYFRNWKIELYLLEGLLPFTIQQLRNKFIGTESGVLTKNISAKQQAEHIALAPQIKPLSGAQPRLAAVVHRYLHDMSLSFESIKKLLKQNGKLIIVCGDNLIGGRRFKTSLILNKMLEAHGFHLIDTFTDKIRSRQLAPKRYGHKGLIKKEVVSVFTKET